MQKNYLKLIGFNDYTEVQSKIMNIPKDKNVLIISPCGSGKTEAAWQYALNLNKPIKYILPRKTLATSLYERLNQYSEKLNIDRWTIQHSGIEEDKFLSNDFAVTTVDQSLTGWLGLGTQSLIRGKNIVDGTLILDETQLFDIDKNFRTTLVMLNSIKEEGYNNFIIMTATMPEYLIDFLKDKYDMEVINCEEESIKNRNVKIYFSEIDFNKVNDCNEKQMFIVNSQKEQEYIYNNIKDKSRCIILNNKLLNTDRLKVEEETFKYFGKKSTDNNKILITTQVVEAGVDISADKVYSALAPIDNVIQRAGRCSRWGGDGELVVFEISEKSVYEEEIIKKTKDEILKHNGEDFTWQLQKEMINEVLNDYYKENINKKTLRSTKMKIRNCDRRELIRDIQAVNVIVDNTDDLFVDENSLDEDSFNKESISVGFSFLEKLKNKEIYKLEKHKVKLVDFKEVENGDTIIVRGNEIAYDKLGLRNSENSYCDAFKYVLNKNNNKTFIDYKEETWLNHTTMVMDCFREKLQKYLYVDYIKENMEDIVLGGALHDLGKLDMAYLNWSGQPEKLLAHFPRNNNIFNHKDRNHKVISTYILKDKFDNMVENIILQHHGRIFINKNNIYISRYKMHNKTIDLLKEFNININKNNIEGENCVISGADVINPSKKEWNIFLRLVGSLMESDIEAIKKYNNID